MVSGACLLMVLVLDNGNDALEERSDISSPSLAPDYDDPPRGDEIVLPVPSIRSRSSSPCRFSSINDSSSTSMYEEFSNFDINMGMDLNHTVVEDGIPVPHNTSHPCVKLCDSDLHCGAVVLRDRDCWFKRAPFFSVGKSLRTTTIARRDMLAQYIFDRQFDRRIVFGMIVRDMSTIQTTVAASLSTWLCRVGVVVVLVHAGEGDRIQLLNLISSKCRPGKHIRIIQAHPDAPHVLVANWEELVATRLLVEAFPLRDWYMIIEHDTFVVMHNLNLELSTFRDPLETKVYGSIAHNGSMWHPANGFGIILSEGAAQLLSDRYTMCVTAAGSSLGCSSQPLGCCMNAHHIPFSTLPNLWSRSPFLAIGVDRRHEHAAFPTSFHQMRRMEWIYDLDAWSTQVVSDIPAACRASSPLEATEMCRLLSLQRLHCGDAARRSGAALSVPLTWDVLSHHLRVEQQHAPEMFERETT